jgi:uncharacterized membrane protein YgdD (TMEM256/DUF423 family)
VRGGARLAPDASGADILEVIMERIFFLAGGLFAVIGVGLGAFGAHALKARLTADALAVFETGVRYQMYHALALLAVAWASARWPGPLITSGGLLLIAGVLVFSGSLYLLALTGIRYFGAVTPIGGLAFMVGWGCILFAAWTASASPGG